MNGADDRLGMSLAVLSFLSGAERARLRTIGDVLKVPDDVLFACVDGLERVGYAKAARGPGDKLSASTALAILPAGQACLLENIAYLETIID